MRLVAFTLPHDPTPRTGVLAHDGARVVDLTEIGVASFADGAARAGRLGRVAAHLLHMPGAASHPPAAVRLGAPAAALVAMYDAATGSPVPVLAAGGGARAPVGPDAAVQLPAGVVLGAGIVAVVGRPARAIAADEAEAHVAGLALVVCWRAGPGRVQAAAVGPWLATLDEFAAPRPEPLAVAVDAALAVNGAVARGGSWAALAARLAPALADASRAHALAPGDAVAAVTFETASEPPRGAPAAAGGLHQLRGRHQFGAAPGDEIVVEATGLGALRVRVAPARREAARG